MLAEPVQHPHSPWISNGTGAGCVKHRRHCCGLGSCHVAREVRVAAPPHSPWIGNGTGAGYVELQCNGCGYKTAAVRRAVWQLRWGLTCVHPPRRFWQT